MTTRKMPLLIVSVTSLELTVASVIALLNELVSALEESFLHDSEAITLGVFEETSGEGFKSLAIACWESRPDSLLRTRKKSSAHDPRPFRFERRGGLSVLSLVPSTRNPSSCSPVEAALKQLVNMETEGSPVHLDSCQFFREMQTGGQVGVSWIQPASTNTSSLQELSITGPMQRATDLASMCDLLATALSVEKARAGDCCVYILAPTGTRNGQGSMRVIFDESDPRGDVGETITQVQIVDSTLVTSGVIMARDNVAEQMLHSFQDSLPIDLTNEAGNPALFLRVTEDDNWVQGLLWWF